MKTPKLLTILLIVVLLAVYIYFVVDYSNLRNHQSTLNAQIAAANGELALIPVPPADLEVQLTAAQDSLNAIKKSLAIDTNDTRIVKRILELGVASGVKAIPLTTQPWVLQSVSDQNYNVFRIDFSVTGTYPQLVNFVKQLESSEPKTLVIESFLVKTTSGASLLDSAARDTLTVSADIKVAIYSPAPVTGQ